MNTYMHLAARTRFFTSPNNTLRASSTIGIITKSAALLNSIQPHFAKQTFACNVKLTATTLKVTNGYRIIQHNVKR